MGIQLIGLLKLLTHIQEVIWVCIQRLSPEWVWCLIFPVISFELAAAFVLRSFVCVLFLFRFHRSHSEK